MNKENFREIFEAYFDAIRNYIYYRIADQHIAEDLAADLFMKLWENREKIELSHVKSLLYKMASDQVIDHYRKQNVRLDFTQHMHIEEENTDSPEDFLQLEELKAKYAIALNEMPTPQREVFLMNREESLKYQEIAERLGLSVKAIEKRMNAALTLLRKKLL